MFLFPARLRAQLGWGHPWAGNIHTLPSVFVTEGSVGAVFYMICSFICQPRCLKPPGGEDGGGVWFIDQQEHFGSSWSGRGDTAEIWGFLESYFWPFLIDLAPQSRARPAPSHSPPWEQQWQTWSKKYYPINITYSFSLISFLIIPTQAHAQGRLTTSTEQNTPWGTQRHCQISRFSSSHHIPTHGSWEKGRAPELGAAFPAGSASNHAEVSGAERLLCLLNPNF